MLEYDLHNHLFGNLTSEDLWILGRNLYRLETDRLAWYASEYEKAWGYKPDPQLYWKKDDGFFQLKKDYEITGSVSFMQFQACFNLIIALCKITPTDTKVLECILTRDQKNLQYVEYRIIYPYMLKNSTDIDEYFTNYAKKVLQYTNASFTPKLVVSLSRESCLSQYTFLRSWLNDNPQLAAVYQGIDFCGVEEGFPPSQKEEFFNKVRQDNTCKANRPLAIMYHVGETLAGITPASSIRWIWQASKIGAHRLGHALSCGIDPSFYFGQKFTEPLSEAIAHLQWLLNNKHELIEYGYLTDWHEISKKLEKLVSSKNEGYLISIQSVDEAYCEQIYALQKATLAYLASSEAIIEACPTSNFCVGQLNYFKNHPLPRFIASGLKVVIATDDSGIFATDLNQEAQVCVEKIGIDRSAMADINQKTKEYIANLHRHLHLPE